MGDPVLKNWKPKEVIKFLMQNGFSVDFSAGKGDHCKLYDPTRKYFTIVDTQHSSFSAREMLGFVKQSQIDKEVWLKWKVKK